MKFVANNVEPTVRHVELTENDAPSLDHLKWTYDHLLNIPEPGVLEEFLSRFRYKRGTHFFVSHAPKRSSLVVMRASAMSSVIDEAPELVTVFIADPAAPYYEALREGREEVAIYLLRRLVMRGEEHEVDEWLRYRGVHVRDPHPQLNDTQAMLEGLRTIQQQVTRDG